jgi:plastocyanin
MNAIYTIIIIAILALGGWFLLGDSFTGDDSELGDDAMEEVMDESGEDGTSMMVPAEGNAGVNEMMVNDGNSMMEEEVMMQNEVSFNVKGVPFSFDMKEIKVKKGDTVTINFESSEGFHDWVVDEFSAATKQVQPGTPTSVTFIADKIGEFEYYCSVGSHRAQGMVGKLIVE